MFWFHNLLSGNREKFYFREVGVSEDQPPADHNKGSWRQSINTRHSNVHNQNPCRFPIKEVGWREDPFQEISQPSGIGRRQIFLWSSNILPVAMCLFFVPIKNLLQCVCYLCSFFLPIKKSCHNMFICVPGDQPAAGHKHCKNCECCNS